MIKAEKKLKKINEVLHFYSLLYISKIIHIKLIN